MKNFSLIVLVILGLLTVSSVFVVNEMERGIVFQFSKIKRDSSGEVKIYEPGLHFKIPLIERVNKLDARIQTLDDRADRFVTAEKKDVLVDSYVKWRIVDFPTFYVRTSGGDLANAEALLKQKVNNGLRTEFGARTIKQIVSGDRDSLMEEAMLSAESSKAELGIEVIDVRVKRINLPDEVSESIYQRMRADRIAVAKEHRSKGREKAAVIEAEINKKIAVLLATAHKTSFEVRGSGDALAAKVYADSFNQDPEFYNFVRSLEAYEKSFSNKGDIMIVKPDSDFFHYLKDNKANR
ncbi:protease modulator HflC [Thalassotalea sp. HSM 43]|uniref:protease modulator HflC n=1 Tax=Thalassotalea sp. HSM 43 TaxID=2552945 RepID=UPI001081B76E|nr:protease modulator HflC [Thalassotalea sp. HSM 43]QBY04660.1 protease modulator HflC [Thalassotalea sp. HSM 43]